MARAVLAFLSVLVTSTASAQRLPTTVVPEHYSLWFAPDLAKETFRGRETIRVVVTESTRSISLNAAEIEFGEVTITAGGRTQTAAVTLDATGERATLTVPEPIREGPASIQITYSGILNDKLRGFYISKANGRKYAVTQMEATDARRAFPSFDEPAFKATFDISMMVDAADTAISNGRVVAETPGPEPGKKTVTYATTERMSTYLVAMIVGDFVCREGAADGTTIRICSTPDKRELTGFALEAAQHQLAFFNDYFGIKYPFGKLDIIAVPDFAAGAMENAGAITFRERLLLVDPARSSLGTRKSVAAVISHEIAHQWFGNLVTMKWWDDIWLNEGFATWLANKPVAAWRPEWRVELDDAEDTQAALGIDALRSTRAIRMTVNTPDEINEVFDGIAYEKTAGVLRMVEHYVGAAAFRAAIGSYLKKYAFKNAAGEDFWTEVARVTGRPIDRILRSYVDQAGAPVLSIRSTCEGGTARIAVGQSRFVGAPGAPVPAPQTWTIPACFKTPTGQPRCEIVDRREQTTTGPACSNVFVNADARGYYLSDYSPEAVRALIPTAAAPAGGLSPLERISLLGDEWWMVRSGRHDIDVYLDLAGALSRDETAAVVDRLAANLGFVSSYVADSDQQTRYQAWIRARFAPALDALGFPGDPADTDERHSRRATLLGLVGGTGNDPDVQRRARELATQYISNPALLPPTVAGTVLQIAAGGGDAGLYDSYLAQVRKAGLQPEEYYRFFSALPSFRGPALVTRTLEFALSDEVRTQDTGTLIAGLLARPASRDAAWAFTQAQWATLVKKLGTFQGIPAIVSALGGYCSMPKAAEIKAFFAKTPVPAAERTLQQAIERIENCAAVDARQSAPFAAWLAKQ
jgi:aminopeptidase N